VPVDQAFADILADPRLALREPPAQVGVAVLRAADDAFMGSAGIPSVHSVVDLAVPGEASSSAASIRTIRSAECSPFTRKPQSPRSVTGLPPKPAFPLRSTIA
jgi:hypothetical protein